MNKTFTVTALVQVPTGRAEVTLTVEAANTVDAKRKVRAACPGAYAFLHVIEQVRADV